MNEWENDWRRLSVDFRAWGRMTEVSQALFRLEKASKRADEFEDKHTLIDLDQAAKKLEKAVAQHLHQVIRFQREVGYLVAAVVQARVLMADQPDRKRPEQVEAEEREQLLAESELGVERLAEFYNLKRWQS